MNKDFLMYIVLVALIFGGLGYFLASYNLNGNSMEPGTENTFESGWNAAEKRIQENGFFPFNEEIKNVSGRVLSVDGNKIKVDVGPIDPLDKPDMFERIVAVTDDTEIYKITEKSPEVFDEEMRVFEEKMENEENLEDGEGFPEPFTKKPATLKDIEEEDYVNVIAPKNIKDEKEFEAIEIEISEY